MNKKSVLLLISIMLISLFSGCNQKAQQNEYQKLGFEIGDTNGLVLPISKTNETIEWSVTSENSQVNDSYFIKKLREITGVNIQLRIVPAASAAEKLKVWVASKDLPNIIGQGFETREANDLAVQGAFAAVSDYIDVLPNFKSTFVDNEKNSWIFKSYGASDGKLYGFYGYDFNRDVNTGITMYRKDIFDKHGLSMWNSNDEFYETLKKLKTHYPNSNPYTLKTGDAIFSSLAYGWGVVAHQPYYDEKTGVWHYSDTDPAFKDMLDFLKKLYDEDLLDPEFLTLTQAAWTSKMTQAEKAFVTTDWIGRMEMFKQQTAETVPNYDLRFANPIGPNQRIKTLSQLCWARYVSNNDQAETSFKLLDFMLSPAGAELISMGVKGETYELDENGKSKYIGFENKIPEMNELNEKYGLFVEGMYLKFDRRSSYFQFSEREQEAQDFAKDLSRMEPIDPILPFTVEQQEVIYQYQANLLTAGKEFATQYILTDKTGDSAWAEWLKKAQSLGSDKVVKVYNEAQKIYNKN